MFRNSLHLYSLFCASNEAYVIKMAWDLIIPWYATISSKENRTVLFKVMLRRWTLIKSKWNDHFRLNRRAKHRHVYRAVVIVNISLYYREPSMPWTVLNLTPAQTCDKYLCLTWGSNPLPDSEGGSKNQQWILTLTLLTFPQKGSG